MTTSGTYTSSQNRDAIITSALRKLGAIASGDTPDGSMVSDGSAALNAMVKHWQGTGLHIWTMAEATLFLQADQVRYTLSSTSTDNATETFYETDISADEAIGQTTISLTDTTNITAADYIGIQLDDGSMHWTTVVSKTSTTALITLALADSATAGNLVVTYTTKIVRPLKIVSARRYNFTSAIDTPIGVEDRETYFDLPLKTGSGTPNILFYDRRGGANAAGYAYFWQPEASPTNAIKFTWARPIQDFAAAADDPDLPQEWIQTLIYNLALNLTTEFDTTPQRFAMIKQFADQYLAEMQWNEKELEAVSFVPDLRR